MGRKSSAKGHNREAQSSDAGAPAPPGRSQKWLLVAALIAFVAVVGGYAYVTTTRESSSTATMAAAHTDHAAPVAQAATNAEPRWAKTGPHKQASLPPFPTQAYAPPRPLNVVRAAYVFAAEHPEILSYVPCFCGCERGGHKGNDDCFVAQRNEKGDVTAWEPHGLECAVCIDVATEAARLHASGAGVRDIRAAIEQKWAGFQGGHTPTPNPPPRAH